MLPGASAPLGDAHGGVGLRWRPMPTGLSQDWLNPVPGEGGFVPHEAILLRWTAAIKEKAEKLLGNEKTGARGYLAKKVVGEGDAYVIAVNARMLRGGVFLCMRAR